MAKKTIKEAKRYSWRSYCLNLNKNVPIKTVWQQLNKYINRPQKNVKILDSSAEWLEQFLNKLTPLFVPYHTPYLDCTDTSHILLRSFTFPELKRSIKQNSNTAPGKDQIHYSMLSHLPHRVKELLLDIFNAIYLGKTPIPED